jgi:Raf kinase inhibitor-like YbhB/YbcL family protein
MHLSKELVTKVALATAVCFLCGLVATAAGAAEPSKKETMQLTSTAFTSGSPIPKLYTGEDKDISPPLHWTGAPLGTKSLALIADDPDAPMGTWVHWVVYDLSPSATGLAEGLPKSQVLPDGARQGITDFKHIGYGGPMPPRGKPHRYFFKLYALDTILGLEAGATKAQVEAAMKGHILVQCQLMGTYQR